VVSVVAYIEALSRAFGGTRYRSWFRHYATSWKITASSPDDVTRFLNLPNISSRTYGPGVDSPSNRNEYPETSWGLRAAGA
jgi:hypothetical protein